LLDGVFVKPTLTPQRILIRAPNWVGDLVMATANFADLRRAYPDAHITVLLKPGRDKILEGSPDLDEIVFDRAGNSLRAMWALARELRRQAYDLTVLFPNSFRTALIAFLARVPRRAGYRRNLRSVLLTDGVKYDVENGKRVPMPMPLFYSKLCERLEVPFGDGRPRLFVSSDCEERATEVRRELGIADGEPLVGLNPGASFGASKLWPPEYFAAFGDAVTERWGLRTILFVGPGEESIGNAIAEGMKYPPINTSARPLPLDILKPFIRDLKLLVTTDTGPRQYAVAFDVPTLVVMGPTDPRYSGINLEKTEVVRHDVPCGPCHLKVCPLDHVCMRGISPEEMFTRLDELHARVGVF
jgi:heptosyltransferase-2